MLCNRVACLWCQPSDPIISAPKGELLVRHPSRPRWPCETRVQRSDLTEESISPAKSLACEVSFAASASSFYFRNACNKDEPSEFSSPSTTWSGAATPVDESLSKGSSSGAVGASGEACSGFYKQLVQVDNCMGSDTLAVDECLVEIDLSAEFPPERREAQEDLVTAHIQQERCLTPTAPIGVASHWWDEANAAAVKGLQEAVVASRLLDIRVIRPPASANAKNQSPWHPGQSEELYKAMGLRTSPASASGSGPEYVALWLNFSSASLMCFAEATDSKRLQAALTDDPLMQRLKLILNPLRLAVPWPQKAPKDIAMLGAYFGPRNASCTQARTSWGVEYMCIHVDLHAKLLLRLLLQNVVFRKGNIIELLVVDWPGKSVLASCRITMTKEALQLLGPERNPKTDLSL